MVWNRGSSRLEESHRTFYADGSASMRPMRMRPRMSPRPPVPRINGWATGKAIQQTIPRPSEMNAPTFASRMGTVLDYAPYQELRQLAVSLSVSD